MRKKQERFDVKKKRLIKDNLELVERKCPHCGHGKMFKNSIWFRCCRCNQTLELDKK